MLIIIFSIASAAACAAVYLRVWRAFPTPFFLFLLAAILGLAGATLAQAIPVPGACALSDLALATSGAGLAAAAFQLKYSFRLAGDIPD